MSKKQKKAKAIRVATSWAQHGPLVLGWMPLALGVVVVVGEEHILLFSFHISPRKLGLSPSPEALSPPKRIFKHSAL